MITKKANFLHVLNNVYFKKTEPVSIVHFITNRCNEKSEHCFYWEELNTTPKNEEIDTNDIEKIFTSIFVLFKSLEQEERFKTYLNNELFFNIL